MLCAVFARRGGFYEKRITVMLILLLAAASLNVVRGWEAPRLPIHPIRL
jgi:hypothetical protein